MPVFIAEVAGNHHQNLNRCLRYVDVAADIGCDAIKFQLFHLEQLFAREILEYSQVHKERKQWELPHKFISPIAARCRQKNILFACTPFDLESVSILLPFVDILKIASYELLYNDLLTACARSGKRTIISTGMATMEEIQSAINVMRKNDTAELSILHCVSNYPTLPVNANLAAIETIRNKIKCKVGWSDHTADPGVIHRAIHHWNAEIIEFHLDIDGKGDDCSAGHCWLPQKMAVVIEQIKSGFSADGTGYKQPSSLEKEERMWRADPSDGLRPFKKIRSAVKQQHN